MVSESRPLVEKPREKRWKPVKSSKAARPVPGIAGGMRIDVSITPGRTASERPACFSHPIEGVGPWPRKN
jgi:hypothetical protein